MKSNQSNIEYYNAIATLYNRMLSNDSDKNIRKKVADTFCAIVNHAVVLDFGGGTGLDLRWLSDNNQTVFFCEPSAGMRNIAVSDPSNGRDNKVIFLEDVATDFRQWDVKLPFVEKVDAVLSNFAVLNCIQEIELLFQNLSLVVKSRGYLIALILTKHSEKTLFGMFYRGLRSFIHAKPMSVKIFHQEHQQTVHIYSLKEIIKASKATFDFCGCELIESSVFTLIKLQRK